MAFDPTTMRRHVPCRVCGATHFNPLSASICPTCGEMASLEAKVAALKAKLAEAVEALEGVMMHMPDFADTLWIYARTTLAKLKEDIAKLKEGGE